jgi:hypothetical protein|tara:strand:- start:457 stop:597 length:141 start_codon:yes stop_codon:yes gene_type:complete
MGWVRPRAAGRLSGLIIGVVSEDHAKLLKGRCFSTSPRAVRRGCFI